MLTAEEIRKLHDKAYEHGQTTREKSSDDLLFFHISQWDDNFLGEGCDLSFRGQFDMLRKAARQIFADLRANPIQVDFEPDEETDEDAGQIADGLYRSNMRNNEAQEAKENAVTEAVVAGYGAWELYTEYETRRNGDERQVIKRRPFYEANNQVMWDPNAKLLDKSDADYVSCLVAYSEDGYKKLVHEKTGEWVNDVPGSFAFPEHSYVFPWVTENEVYYVTRFYHRVKEKVKTFVFQDQVGSERVVRDEKLSDIEDELFEDGFEIVSMTEKEQYQIYLYIVGGGDEVISMERIPGEELPVIPVYGERGFVESQEHYEGITRLVKDPQRLRNFQMSYLADIVSRSPRRKPIFFPEQVQGFEYMYENNGADNNYPYLLQQRHDPAGNELPMGPVGELPEQPMPTALAQSFEMTRQAINDVASADLPQDIADTNLSGKALENLQRRFDMQSYTYQHNQKYALRRDGQVWASMAREVYDTEREVTLTKFDGTRSTETINEQEIDAETLQIKVKNNLADSVFEVYADVGPSYTSVKEQTKSEVKEMIMTMAPDDPMRQIYMLQFSAMADGITMKPIRDYARKQLILMDIYEPETEEEKMMVAQQKMQQQNQQDPQAMMAMMEGEARIMEGQAALQNEENDRAKNQIDAYEAETKRKEVEVKAVQAGVDIQYKQAQTDGVRIDNVSKVTGSDLRGRSESVY